MDCLLLHIMCQLEDIVITNEKRMFLFFSNPKEFQEAFDIVLKRQKDGLWNEKDIIEIYYSISSLEAGCQRLKDFLFKR